MGAGTVSGNGIIERCQDASEFTPDDPEAGRDRARSRADQRPTGRFPLATDRTEHPRCSPARRARASPGFTQRRALEFSQLAVPKDLPIDDDTFGKSLAVLSVGDGRVYAVGVSNKNEVLLWKSDGSKSSSYIGCLGGTPGFGRALAGGKVNRDDDADLVVSDNVDVHVIDGRALFDLPETTSPDCSFASLPAGALLDSFGCGTNKSLHRVAQALRVRRGARRR